MRNEVIMFRCDRGTEADPVIRAAGGRIVDVGTVGSATETQFTDAINERTAAVLILAGERSERFATDRVVTLAHERGVSVLVDGAYALPPKENLWRFTRDLGVDAFITSGGKAMRGPQSTGLVLGKHWLIDGCKYHSSPNLRVGRGMKVGKEEFAGMYAALKLFLENDFNALAAGHARQLNVIGGSLKDIQHVSVSAVESNQLQLGIDEDALGMTAEAVAAAVLANDPSVLLLGRNQHIIIRANMLQLGEEQIVADCLRKVLRKGVER